ncbi:hypothetical protein D3C77_671630 [compost metagenome]
MNATENISLAEKWLLPTPNPLPTLIVGFPVALAKASKVAVMPLVKVTGRIEVFPDFKLSRLNVSRLPSRTAFWVTV